MKYLKNWDNKTWLSSKKYIEQFHKFLKLNIKINKSTKILDLGCGRGKIVSFLNNKYKFINKPIGIDIYQSNQVKKNIIFKKIDAVKYLIFSKKTFDLILIKQTIHFFKKKEINILLNLAKNHLSKKGKIIVLSLETKNNEFPFFKAMKIILNKSLKRDDQIIKIIKKNFIKYKKSNFKFKVSISRNVYLKMIEKRYISSLIDVSKKEIKQGVSEIKSKYEKKLQFNDTLNCLIYQN